LTNIILSRHHPRSKVDLHLHTDRSDGAHPPAEVLRRCAHAGLDLIALTDHDLISPIEPGTHDVDGRTITVIAGAELTGLHEGREYHLLVYFPGTVPAPFRDYCKRQCVSRAERYLAAVANLGLPDLRPPDAEALAGNRSVTRLHLARDMVRAGHARHVSDAFDRYLGRQHGTVPQVAPQLVDVLRIATENGGITSWAHPSVDDVERHLPALVEAGLHGIEGLRPRLVSKDRRKLRLAARAHGLFLTGGSDWHGWTGDSVGLFRLQLTEVADFVDALQAA